MNGIGPGIWFRQRFEQLLVGTKGQISPPEPEDRCDSVIDSRRQRHSQKPTEAYERILGVSAGSLNIGGTTTLREWFN